MCILLHHTISIKLRGGGWQRDWGNCTYFSITIWKKNTISISTTPFNLPPPSSLKNVLAKFNLVVLRRYWKCKRLADKRWSEKFTLAFSLGELFACQAFRLPYFSLLILVKLFTFTVITMKYLFFQVKIQICYDPLQKRNPCDVNHSSTSISSITRRIS